MDTPKSKSTELKTQETSFIAEHRLSESLLSELESSMHQSGNESIVVYGGLRSYTVYRYMTLEKVVDSIDRQQSLLKKKLYKGNPILTTELRSTTVKTKKMIRALLKESPDLYETMMRKLYIVLKLTGEKKIEALMKHHLFYYYNDQRTTIVDNQLDLVELQNVIKKKLSTFDALVLIDPDYLSVERKKLYLKNLKVAIAFCKLKGIPVLVKRFQINKHEKPILPDSFFNGTTIVSFKDEDEDFKTTDETQQEINVISQIINKRPKDIKLAFGGMLIEWCIQQWMNAWCQTKNEQDQRRELPSNPIAYGEIIHGISVNSPL